ncbi:MAG: hypothetical protein KF836_13230 [Fimbriimonadaceae bacterium]|nr:hypothetical protein [Fimbriimonadaceae bacterium]
MKTSQQKHRLRVLTKVVLFIAFIVGMIGLSLLPILKIKQPDILTTILLTKDGGGIQPEIKGEEFSEMVSTYGQTTGNGDFKYDWPQNVREVLGDKSEARVLDYELANLILDKDSEKFIQFNTWDNLREEPYQRITILIRRKTPDSIQINLKGIPLQKESNIFTTTQYSCNDKGCTLEKSSWVQPVDLWAYLD